MEKIAVVYIILVFGLISLIAAAPTPQTDNDDTNFDVLPNVMNQSVDYNAVMGHFKDFFMYLPVMFTSFRETMSGFPKLAEGLRILTNPSFDKIYDEDDDCKCKTKSRLNSNEIDKSGNLFS
ncbi:hypothetical protein CVS40_5930 [Lucilia cuprina]|nr:hypothetical protein CVS40_5930 [Lucilia cuprina]